MPVLNALLIREGPNALKHARGSFSRLSLLIEAWNTKTISVALKVKGERNEGSMVRHASPRRFLFFSRRCACGMQEGLVDFVRIGLVLGNLMGRLPKADDLEVSTWNG